MTVTANACNNIVVENAVQRKVCQLTGMTLLNQKEYFCSQMNYNTHDHGGAENAGVENAGVEKAGAITYGKPSEQKTLKTPGV